MKTRELAAIGTKLSGIGCLVVAAWKLNYFILVLASMRSFDRSSPMQMEGAGWLVAAIVLSFVLILVAGLVLVFLGDRIGQYISRDDSEVCTAVDSSSLLVVGIALVGIWIVAVSVPELLERIGVILIHISSFGPRDPSGVMKTKFMPELFGDLIKTGLGFWMFFGSKGIVAIRDRLREAGLRKDTQHPSPPYSENRGGSPQG
ncbi:MAG: hypothetical protein WCL44_06755 [bacterium]